MLGAGGHRASERRQAIFVALAVLLAAALITGAVVVVAKTINGTSGNDNLSGTELADTINAGAGDDVINGLGGNDTILARDEGPDTIDCGPGNDTAYVDRSEDGVYDCETVITP